VLVLIDSVGMFAVAAPGGKQPGRVPWL